MNVDIDNEKSKTTDSSGTGGGNAEGMGNQKPSQEYSLVPLISGVVAVLCSAYLFFIFNFANGGQNLLFGDTIPTGGDMGAHILGPAFMRDELLPQLRLSGWSTYWYAGFPAYTFYMVIPPLMIITINAGLSWYISIPLVLLFAAFAVSLRGSQKVEAALREAGTLREDSHLARWRKIKIVQILGHYQKVFFIAVPILAIWLTHVPYGIAFKLVTVSGVVFFPLSAWVMGRLARSPEPIPGLLAIGALIFQLDTNFQITGGNVLSTLAGEFSASISLNLTLLALGVCIRGISDNKWHIRSAVLLALVALTHILPLFFLVPALLLVLLLRKNNSPMHLLFLGAISTWLVAISFNEGKPTIFLPIACVLVAAVVLYALITYVDIRRNALWLAIVGATSFALASFWLIPFLWAGKFDGLFIDMGFERLEAVGAKMMTDSMEIAMPIAVVGALLSYVIKTKIGVLFSCQAILMGLLTANIGQGALWNERLLPFFYLSVYFVCAVGVGLILRFVAMAVAESWEKPTQTVLSAGLVFSMLAGFVATALPLQIELPGSQEVQVASDNTVFKWLVFENRDNSSVQGWSKHNYSGYEGTSGYLEYRDVVNTMAAIGEEQGCGRAKWELNKDLDYGTPMAMMLLPHWTDGCITSMEGLYFESSATTPFHFLNQSRLSKEPSRAQRDLPYQDFDIAKGVSQLQATGVKYYLASKNDSITAACAFAQRATGSVCDLVDPQKPDLSRVQEVLPLEEIDLDKPETQPFAVFKVLTLEEIDDRKEALKAKGLEVTEMSSSFPVGAVRGGDVVEGLENYPVVVDGLDHKDFLEDDIEEKATVEKGVLSAVAESIDEQVAEVPVEQSEALRVELEETWLKDSEHDRRFENGWIGQAVDFHNDPSSYAAIPAESGPDSWPKQTGDSIEERVLPMNKEFPTAEEQEVLDAVIKPVEGGPAVVSDIKTTTNEISFSVDEIGKPVLVKTSYFTNWNVKGAQGPWRAGPNMMVVVPTEKNVSFSYGRTGPELVSTALSLLALLGICGYAIRRRYSSFETPALAEVGASAEPADGVAEASAAAEQTVRDSSEEMLEEVGFASASSFPVIGAESEIATSEILSKVVDPPATKPASDSTDRGVGPVLSDLSSPDENVEEEDDKTADHGKDDSLEGE